MNLEKPFTLFLFVSFVLSMYSQKNMISVKYKVDILTNEDFYKVPAYRQIQSDAQNKVKNYTFTLLIKNNKSKFFDNPILDNDTNNSSQRAVFYFVNYRGKTYTSNDSIFTHYPAMGNNVYRLAKKTNNWNITSETKLINNYKCFKAISSYLVVNPIKTFEHPIVAWFCPDLPYAFGPLGYANLPGLILELQVRNSVYGATKIDIESTETFTLNDLKNIKTLTIEQIEKILEDDINKKN